MKSVFKSIGALFPLRVVGILATVLVLYFLILTADESALSLRNHQILASRVAFFGILTLGAGMLILSGGIDLSMGSVVCLAGVLLGLLLNAPPERSAIVFGTLGCVLMMAFVAAAMYARVRDQLPARYSIPIALLSLPLAPLALILLLFRPLRQRLPAALAIPLALLFSAGLFALPLGLAWLFQDATQGWLALVAVLLVGVTIGLLHGLLVTKLRLQPFVVTLCGLFIWRGMAYWLALPDPVAPIKSIVKFLSFDLLFEDAPSSSASTGIITIKERNDRYPELTDLSNGYPRVPDGWGVAALGWIDDIPQRFLLLLGLSALAFVFLHLSVYGRYLAAVGANEQAARYAGINTDRYKLLAYVLCSTLSALTGVLLALEVGSTQPSSAGNFYELYAITGAVLGGCSLRGGEGLVVGMLLGTAVLPLLYNLITLAKLPPDLEHLIVGFALLMGTIFDELLKRRAARKK